MYMDRGFRVCVFYDCSYVFFGNSNYVLGAKANFEIGTYYPYFRFNSYDFVTEPPWNIMPTLLMLIPSRNWPWDDTVNSINGNL